MLFSRNEKTPKKNSVPFDYGTDFERDVLAILTVVGYFLMLSNPSDLDPEQCSPIAIAVCWAVTGLLGLYITSPLRHPEWYEDLYANFDRTDF